MIEVEIKVHVTDEQATNLISGAELIANKSFVDTYYDSVDYSLTIKGFWLRQRDQQFELKLPATKDGSFHIGKNIPMHEITEEQEIRQLLGLSNQEPFTQALLAAGYKPLYQFTNTRKTYKKGAFHVDFDRAVFGDITYCLCEVEMMVESEDQTEQALDSLYAFVKEYGIATERAEGKLGYFIRLKNPAHYQAVLQSTKHQR